MNEHESMVTFDALGAFEIRDESLLRVVAAGGVAVADGPGPTGAESNTVCVNGGCFTLNVYCPTQKICAQFFC